MVFYVLISFILVLSVLFLNDGKNENDFEIFFCVIDVNFSLMYCPYSNEYKYFKYILLNYGKLVYFKFILSRFVVLFKK